ncbi:MAG: cytochrome o ubiquinol oxidase subunit III [Gammaproteobacteria bacterium]|nr:MAG: cytochrome o ubiquinol oxidase subunit III [Gammaproteobacteria bacterium]
MSTDTAIQEAALHGHDDHHDEHHHDTSDITMFGFWVYIMSDCLLFATLFAVYAAMSTGYSYGDAVQPKELFGLGLVFVETMFLLISSFTFGMAMLGAYAKDMARMKKWLIATFVLGACFLSMELYEFYHLAHEGATPQASGYWTAFFSLVATHGLHVFTGLCWMVAMIFHFKREGFSDKNMTRLSCLSLFWHFLDVIWICVFSFVYLGGML